MLEIDNLSVHYGAIHAIKSVSVRVEQGQIVTLIGSNGAGKTTTLRAVSGMVRPTGGRVLYQGRPLAGLPAHKIVRMGISQAPEGRGVFANLTVRENLGLGAYIRKDHAAVAQDMDKALSIFPRLRERLGQMAGTLSGGEQQMLAIARALLARPRLLLLDEPSLGLAPQMVQLIFRIIREINQSGTTILLVEQNAHMALQVAHHAVVLEVGQSTLSGPAADLAASDEVRKAYLGHG
ncbi:MAG: ABC transporter ATP-binding protein [Planctomyces sp.]|nr:ABC transporter ATP-binding protein [Planctomyces sp.]MBA4120721.1 ABC transporter ATP-binding protein [Isosphaera sp.]